MHIIPIILGILPTSTVVKVSQSINIQAFRFTCKFAGGYVHV